jgi:putative transposase
MDMPRLGTRNLYYLLSVKNRFQGIKIGRDGLFDYLRSEYMQVKPKNNFTKMTNSNHWLRKNLTYTIRQNSRNNPSF